MQNSVPLPDTAKMTGNGKHMAKKESCVKFRARRFLTRRGLRGYNGEKRNREAKSVDFFGALAQWFTNNEGGLSVLLSALAVVISLLAIAAQNKGVLFEKRAEVYYAVGAIDKKLRRILDKGLQKSAAASRFICAVILFSAGSEEYAVFEALRPLEQAWEKAYIAAKEEDKAALEKQFLEDARVKALLDRYAEIYQKKYLENALADEAELLYGNAIAAQVAALGHKVEHAAAPVCRACSGSSAPDARGAGRVGGKNAARSAGI